ncbi:MAG TPA: TolC family protein [Kofleriaceae bacterium]|nr:TolC family protein [Kofleriaceae bacterium]
MIVSILVALPSYAHADLWRRAIDGADAGASAGTSAQEDDLVKWAGEAKPITLPELLQLAMRQNPALANAKLDIAVAEAQIAESWSRRDWTLGANLQYSKAGSSAFSGIQLQGTTQATASIDIGRVLPTGGTIDFKVDTNYQHTDKSDVFPESNIWTSDISGSITQPLLKGYGSDLYNAQERRATLSRDVVVLARRLVALNTVEAVVSAYWDLVLAEQQVAITEQSLALARERLRVTEIQVKGGKVADAEVPAVQQIIATREEDVLNGELLVLDRSIALRRACGMQVGAGELGLRVATDLGATDTQLDLPDLINRTYNASPELAELDKQDKESSIDIEVTENGLLPQLDLALQAGPRGQDTSFASSAKDTVEFKSYQVGGQLTFSRSLHKYDIHYKLRELHAVREKLRVNAFDIRAQLAEGMAQAVAQMELAKRRVVLSQRAIDLAKENIRIETDRFNLGRSTNFDVLNRLEEQRQAELRRAQAMIDWHKAETVVQTLTGDLLPKFGVTVE